jgi:hypothetical protein
LPNEPPLQPVFTSQASALCSRIFCANMVAYFVGSTQISNHDRLLY